jgi:hypothetical protein
MLFSMLTFLAPRPWRSYSTIVLVANGAFAQTKKGRPIGRPFFAQRACH